MKILTATEFKNRPAEALNLKASETILVKKYGKDACFIFNANTGKRLVLYAYSEGVLSRTDTMNLLGLDWYGTLLDELKSERIPLPVLPPEEIAEMVKRASEMLAHARNPHPRSPPPVEEN